VFESSDDSIFANGNDILDKKYNDKDMAEQLQEAEYYFSIIIRSLSCMFFWKTFVGCGNNNELYFFNIVLGNTISYKCKTVHEM